MSSLHDLTHAQLTEVLTSAGLPAAHVKTLWNSLHFRSMTDPLAREDLSPPLRRWLERAAAEKTWQLDVLPVASDIPSSDGLTRKALLKLADGQEIETVIMGYEGRHTACISTQAGCAMGCVFCATGQMGFVRHLRPGEIVAQVHHARRVLAESGQKLRNLVFMGMGEPLHNYDAVMTALDIITHTSGINLGPSKVSISTVGVVPGILASRMKTGPTTSPCPSMLPRMRNAAPSCPRTRNGRSPRSWMPAATTIKRPAGAFSSRGRSSAASTTHPSTRNASRSCFAASMRT